jgi:5-methylthioribose kinase
MFELTPENAADYLRAKGWLSGPSARLELLGGGVSNMVLMAVTDERRFVVKQSRPQLRTREAWFSDMNRIFREVEVMRLLGPLLPGGTVPEVLFVDPDNYLFAMAAAAAGSIVWKESLLRGQVSGPVARRAGLVLGLMHELTSRRPELVEQLGDRTVFTQLRTEPFYQRVAERLPDTADAVASLVGKLNTTQEALCHGDFSPKNFLVHPLPAHGPFTLVDYETAHFGDPTMDIGFFLSHLMLKAFKNDAQRESYFELTRAFWKSYQAVVRFRPEEELEARGILHFAVCLLARIDGTSPVDYLPEEAKREAVRWLGRQVLKMQPRSWQEVLGLVEHP